MGTIIVRHRVADFDTWKTAYNEHNTMREQYGINDVSLHRDADDPSMVSVILKADDLDKAREFAASADLREAMEGAGVISQPDIWFTTDA
jgi:hypothetical protein